MRSEITLGKSVRFEDHWRYQYLLDMEGNTYSQRFRSLLLTGSPVLKLDPWFDEFFYPLLVPWEHFIPVRYGDVADLVDRVISCTLTVQCRWSRPGGKVGLGAGTSERSPTDRRGKPGLGRPPLSGLAHSLLYGGACARLLGSAELCAELCRGRHARIIGVLGNRQSEKGRHHRPIPRMIASPMYSTYFLHLHTVQIEDSSGFLKVSARLALFSNGTEL